MVHNGREVSSECLTPSLLDVCCFPCICLAAWTALKYWNLSVANSQVLKCRLVAVGRQWYTVIVVLMQVGGTGEENWMDMCCSESAV